MGRRYAAVFEWHTLLVALDERSNSSWAATASAASRRRRSASGRRVNELLADHPGAAGPLESCMAITAFDVDKENARKRPRIDASG